MITNEDIIKIADEGSKESHNIKVSDIAYTILKQFIKDNKVCFTVLFGKDFSDDDLSNYDKSKKIKFLSGYMMKNYHISSNISPEDIPEDISLEELKSYVLWLKSETERCIRDKEIPKKDGIKTLVDISTKLIDKFSVSDNSSEQRVIVHKKYNDICECGREIYRPTKEDIMEDLMQEYDLIPKKEKKENNLKDGF